MEDDFLEISQFYDDIVYDKTNDDNDLFYIISITLSYVSLLLWLLNYAN